MLAFRHPLQLTKSHNNLAMRYFLFGNIEVVDISYCMSHAPKAVKEVAIYVSDNFADAVTHLENLLDS